MSEREEKISELKPNMESVSVKVRVLESGEQKVINTRSGQRTISEAIVGDESGRVKLTLWGQLAGQLKQGQVVKIVNAWTTVYKGEVQLNAGSKSKIENLKEDKEIPEAEAIPQETPKAPEGYVPRRRQMGGRGGSYRKGGFRKGYKSNYNQEDDE